LAIAIIVFACLWIARPLLGVLVSGALIASPWHPLHRVMAGMLGNRPKGAAALLVLVLLALLVVPLFFLPSSIERAASGIARMTNWTELNLPSLQLGSPTPSRGNPPVHC
jgi:predicted PurR-regulated permease PerM